MKQQLIWLKILSQKNSNSGMSLMEALVAMLLISVMVVVTTPPLILAMATRIQTRRTETAVTLAQKELERIRLIVDTGTYTNNMLPPQARNSSNANITTPGNISQSRPPTSLRTTQTCTVVTASCDPSNDSQAWWVDSSQEFFVQTFRTTGVQQNGQVVVFRMGIRVYSKIAQQDIANLRTEAAPMYLTRGAGERTVVTRNAANISARQSQFPLAVIYADFSRGDLIGSLQRYHQFIGN
jgi:type II secretory pathway pseudopilin PulG